jgi:signal transduction histidine kinase
MADSIARQREHELAFLASVAHDLRNPLSVLKMATTLIAEGEQTGASREKLFAVVKRQVVYLDRMVGDLLDSLRIEAGTLELRLGRSDARTCVQGAFELFQHASVRHQMSLVLPDQPVMAFWDTLRIEQVLNNLLSNAIKYSPQGGPIVISMELQGETARIKVSDAGIGIPESDRHSIFEPFYRAQLSKADVPGIGLGLSVARRIVEAHKGRIDIKSQVGKGTTFLIELPLNP